MTARTDEPLGTCCIVLHTHLPWLAHHGAWPVGEEWLHQAWATSYLPVVEVLERLAGEGRRHLLTLGVTPVLAAQLDDPYCLDEFHTWLGFWQVRAEAAAVSARADVRALSTAEFRQARGAVEAFEDRWRHGGSAVLRPLSDAGVVELLGGPAAHPFQPLLPDRVVRFSLEAGLSDTAVRLGRRPTGIWAPECGYRPGLEQVYADAGVGRFLVDGPTLQATGRSTAEAVTVGASDVVAFARDLEVTYRVWSPRRGYPGGPWYRDFHTWDHETGLRPARVTSTRTVPEDKAPYDPLRALAAVQADADDFVTQVRQRLLEHRDARDGRPGLVVVAYDTELFGHWWHEGPAFLEAVLRRLPEAGVRLATLAGAVDAGLVGPPVDLGPGSWGSGKDYRVWDGEQVADLVAENDRVARRLTAVVDAAAARSGGTLPERRPDLDQLARDALLALGSDWAFMVSKDSAAGYARHRARRHVRAFDALADVIEAGWPEAAVLAEQQRRVDGPFGRLDARLLAAPRQARVRSRAPGSRGLRLTTRR